MEELLNSFRENDKIKEHEVSTCKEGDHVPKMVYNLQCLHTALLMRGDAELQLLELKEQLTVPYVEKSFDYRNSTNKHTSNV